MAESHVADLFQELRQLVANTLDSVKSGQYSLKVFDRIFELSQCVPMTASEYQAMMRRAYGAMEYCLDSEFGAATFDLRMLLRSIERVMASQAVSVRSPIIITPRSVAPRQPAESYPPAMRA